MVSDTDSNRDLMATAALAGGVLVLALGTWAWVNGAVTMPLPLSAAGPPPGAAPSSSWDDEGWLPLQRQEGGAPVGWDSCRPVHYVVSGQAPATLAPLLDAAVGEVSRATGLTFVADGVTGEPPTSDRASVQRARYGERWAPVLVAWSDPQASPKLAGSVLGYAGPVPDGGYARNDHRYVTGTVVLDAPQLADLASRQAGVARVRATMVHELAHLVGLDHVDDPRQLMYPTAPRLVVAPADGDRRGLAVLGAQPCFGDR